MDCDHACGKFPGVNETLATRFPQRATAWKLRSRTLSFGQRPLLMGIVNVTPDSFSDGGRYFSTQGAIDHAMRLVDEGAEILDIGGESTRPYATPVEAAEELRRTTSVIREICRRTKVVVSIDTSKAAVARAALDAGAEIINDVTGLTGDVEMLPLAVSSQAGVCAMHMQGTPQTMQDAPTYRDVVDDILGYLAQRRDALLVAGVDRERICLDPGIGFGKTHQHNLTLLANCWRYHVLDAAILVGPSRKGFIGKVLGDKEADRTAGTVGVCLSLARQGVQLLRVHDVAAVRQALLLFAAAGGIDGAAAEISD
jgi:dihydropteroate synthase